MPPWQCARSPTPGDFPSRIVGTCVLSLPGAFGNTSSRIRFSECICGSVFCKCGTRGFPRFLIPSTLPLWLRKYRECTVSATCRTFFAATPTSVGCFPECVFAPPTQRRLRKRVCKKSIRFKRCPQARLTGSGRLLFPTFHRGTYLSGHTRGIALDHL